MITQVIDTWELRHVHGFFVGLQTLQREAERKKPSVEAMTDAHRALTALNPETTAKAEVSLKLESVKTPYTELCRKLGTLQG